MLELAPHLRLSAFPIVGTGGAYAEAGVDMWGPRRALPSGGLLMHSLPLLLADLRQGFVGLTLSQLRFLAGQRTNALVVVGDVYAQLLASTVRARSRFVIQTLVSAHHSEGLAFSAPNRLFMERITAPERLLMRYRADRVYVRDAVTELALREAGLAHVAYLGNPIADMPTGAPLEALSRWRRVVALLPGSRSYAPKALQLMLSGLERIRAAPFLGALAWSGGDLPAVPGWQRSEPRSSDRGLIAELLSGEARVLVYHDRFADILRSSRLVLGTSGTANEQAVALGRPVVAFPVPPHYSKAFLANQKRLLGPALKVVSSQPGDIAAAVAEWLDDPATAERAGIQGKARVGGPGGSAAIAEDVLGRLDEPRDRSPSPR